MSYVKWQAAVQTSTPAIQDLKLYALCLQIAIVNSCFGLLDQHDKLVRKVCWKTIGHIAISYSDIGLNMVTQLYTVCPPERTELPFLFSLLVRLVK